MAPALSSLKRRYPAMDLWLELLDRRVELVGESFLFFRVRVQALVLAFQHGFLMATLAFLSCLILLMLLKKPKPGGAPDPAAH